MLCAVALSIWAETPSGPLALDESRVSIRNRTSSVVHNLCQERMMKKRCHHALLFVHSMRCTMASGQVQPCLLQVRNIDLRYPIKV